MDSLYFVRNEILAVIGIGAQMARNEPNEQTLENILIIFFIVRAIYFELYQCDLIKDHDMIYLSRIYYYTHI